MWTTNFFDSSSLLFDCSTYDLDASSLFVLQLACLLSRSHAWRNSATLRVMLLIGENQDEIGIKNRVAQGHFSLIFFFIKMDRGHYKWDPNGGQNTKQSGFFLTLLHDKTTLRRIGKILRTEKYSLVQAGSRSLHYNNRLSKKWAKSETHRSDRNYKNSQVSLYKTSKVGVYWARYPLWVHQRPIIGTFSRKFLEFYFRYKNLGMIRQTIQKHERVRNKQDKVKNWLPIRPFWQKSVKKVLKTV